MTGMNLSNDLYGEISQAALRLGFADIGYIAFKNNAATADNEFIFFYQEYLKSGFQASQSYLENKYLRTDLNNLKDRVDLVFLLLHPYRHKAVDAARKKHRSKKIAYFAWGRDYHKTLRKKTAKLFRQFFIQGTFRVFSDSAPVAERYWARRAGLGFIGKNGMLIHRQLGSYFLISGAVVTEVNSDKNGLWQAKTELENRSVKDDIKNYCNSCDRCIKACPGNAIKPMGLIDSAACISYQTIENKNRKEDQNYQNVVAKTRWVFGCDICNQVCPYNQKPVYTLENDFSPRKPSVLLAKGQLGTEEDMYGMAIRRPGIEGLKLNIRTSKK